ncbi:unnamed protein product [Caretta caretta]
MGNIFVLDDFSIPIVLQGEETFGLSIHTSGVAHPDKKEKEEEKEDMFQEILPVSGALDTEQTAWRMILGDRINGQQEIIALLRE